MNASACARAQLSAKAYLKQALAWRKTMPFCRGSSSELNEPGRYSCPADLLELGFESCSSIAPINASDFVGTHAGKSIVLFGDSLLRQLFYELLCQLGGTVVDADLSSPVYKWARLVAHGIPALMLSFVYQQLLGHNATTGRADFDDPLTLRSDARHALTLASTVVFNAGAFASGFDQLAGSIDEFASFVRRLDVKVHARHQSGRGAHKHQVERQPSPQLQMRRLLFVEYMAPHFASRGGDYTKHNGWGFGLKTGVRYGCKPGSPAAFLASDAAYRWTRTSQHVRSLGVRLVPAFELTMLAWRQHSFHSLASRGVQDCRHWCAPSPILEAQTRLLVTHLLRSARDEHEAPSGGLRVGPRTGVWRRERDT